MTVAWCRRLHQVSRCYAASAKEIVLCGDIPSEAIVERFEVDTEGQFGKLYVTHSPPPLISFSLSSPHPSDADGAFSWT